MFGIVIYKITNTLNNKCYIGQTIRDLEVRIQEHIRASNTNTGFYINNAIAKYGWENFRVDVIAVASTPDELDRLEEFYIQKFDSIRNGYNLAHGGHINCMDSEKVRLKHLRSMRSDDVRSRISKTLSEKIKREGRTEEYVSNMRRGFQEYLKSDKFKEDCKNRHLSPEHFRALNDAKNKSVYCINEKGEVVATFNRVKDAAYWWWNNGYHVKSYDQLMDRIKESSKYNKYIRGLKWIYRV